MIGLDRLAGLCRSALYNAHALLMKAAMLFSASVIVVVLWVVVFERSATVRSDRVLDVEPASRMLDRDTSSLFRIVREVCSRRDTQVELVRNWTEETPNDQVRPVALFSTVYTEILEGCHRYDILQHIPESLRPGRYVYEVAVRSCNSLNQCMTHRLRPVPVSVLGGSWPAVAVLHPSPLDPALPKDAKP